MTQYNFASLVLNHNTQSLPDSGQLVTATLTLSFVNLNEFEHTYHPQALNDPLLSTTL